MPFIILLVQKERNYLVEHESYVYYLKIYILLISLFSSSSCHCLMRQKTIRLPIYENMNELHNVECCDLCILVEPTNLKKYNP